MLNSNFYSKIEGTFILQLFNSTSELCAHKYECCRGQAMCNQIISELVGATWKDLPKLGQSIFGWCSRLKAWRDISSVVVLVVEIESIYVGVKLLFS